MISFKNNQEEFLLKLNENQQLVQGSLSNFIEELSSAIQQKKELELSYACNIDPDIIIYTGILVDMYASRSIHSKTSPFILFELNVQGESILIPSPLLNDQTVERNTISTNPKYYLLDTMISLYAKKLEPRMTILIKD